MPRKVKPPIPPQKMAGGRVNVTPLGERKAVVLDADGQEVTEWSGSKSEARELARHDRKTKFLQCLAETGVINFACVKTGVNRSTVRAWQEDDPLFGAAFNEALAISTEVMEAEAIRRATKGWTRPAIQSGRLVGYVREYSDILLIFMLKARRPEVYRDRYDVRVQGTQDWVPLSDLLAELPQAALPAGKTE